MQKLKPSYIKKLELAATRRLHSRLRRKFAVDFRVQCYTCEAVLDVHCKQLHMGHFLNTYRYAAVRYEEDNIRPQCLNCNVMKHGNLDVFERNLRAELGEKRFEALKFRARPTRKFTDLELMEIR